MKRLSIIIVSWNARDLLRACLRSVAETASELEPEVVVVDNASHDGSPEMVAGEFPGVALVQLPENVGFARANNVGLRRATGSHVALINSDIVVHAGCFQRLLDYLAAHPEAGLVAPRILDRKGKLQPNWRRQPTILNTTARALALDVARDRLCRIAGRTRPQPQQACPVEVLNGCFWVARREAVERVGELDERFFFYAEDIDWSRRFRANGWSIVLVPSATATHFGGGSSANAPIRFSIEMLRADLAYWKKHHGVIGEFLFYLLCLLHHGLRLVPRGCAAALARGRPSDSGFKYQRSKLCLRWLLFRRGV